MKVEAPFQYDFALDGKAAVEDLDDHLIVEGYAATFDFDRQDEAFEPGVFEEGMKSFMENNPIVIYHHKYDQAMGEVLELEHKAAGPWVKVRLDKPEPSSPLADVYTKVKKGVIKGFSVGGKFYRRIGQDGRRRIHRADIAELSVTPLPINGGSLFALAGKAFGENDELDELQARLEAVADTFTKIEQSLS